MRDTPSDTPSSSGDLGSVSRGVASQGISWGGAGSDAARLMSQQHPLDVILGSHGSGPITPYEVLHQCAIFVVFCACSKMAEIHDQIKE